MRKFLGCFDEKTFAKFAQIFSSFVRPGMVVLLIGELGTGKTTFVKQCATGLGIDPNRVRSPTFSLINVYEGDVKIFHVDLYRLNKDLEVVMEIEEIIERKDSVIFVEWADRLQSFWIGWEIKLMFDFCDAGRTITIESENEQLISQLQERWSEFAQV
ncbi:tRNA (adenosine(37)-N6)-threonylcarbamoyltransferase complex ATPase subunit type 1 TsaE [Pseudothermotoga sp.]|nr:tRNA (adenosine(37)-N6)-threonylcarbamoyltransferase complex ATPase subunit type 1 TsaE [Pseudothermotoga sp.]MCX7812766.1 tRNA (adenosine(37)-N6)-threonylcarbamoyltransferase complex ATPase subunit type 1 TsaE [Pseudothermotoga sp.]MDW8139046.1 tRNA (adenosine(37)-N6)-threonylcarbamoyltransferase complex ATPase subunit type 1 TsaE [Pseudothermotoga sp.]